MRIAIAPNAYRGSLTAIQAAEYILAGLQQSNLPDHVLLKPLLLPLADGGDGTLEVLLHQLGGQRLSVEVQGPLGSNQPILAEYGLLADQHTAVIEMARASGVELLNPEQRNPLHTTSYGTGQLIRAAVEQGATHIYLGIGGSATVDGGVGCLQALGVQLLDANDQPIRPTGDGLAHLARLDHRPALDLLRHVRLTILSDVTNLLCGLHGAAAVFGPQKGATPDMVAQLDANLMHFAQIAQRDAFQSITSDNNAYRSTTLPAGSATSHAPKIDLLSLAGGGAAGGMGAGLVGVLGAEIRSGANALMELLGYPAKLHSAQIVITGEGKLDAQTAGGKAVQQVTALARQAHIPVLALVGTLDVDAAELAKMGITAAWSMIQRPCSLPEALAHAGPWLQSMACQVGNVLALRYR